MLLASILLLASLVFIPIIIWFLWFKCSKFGQLVDKLPGPKPLPLVGNSIDIAGDCDFILNTLHVKWPQTYGEIYRFLVGSRVAVVVSSPELIESVMNSQTIIDKGFGYDFLHPWLGRGLLTSSGAKWKSRRRLLTPAFHFHIMEDFFDGFNEQSAILCRKIETLCSTKEKTEIDVEKLTSLCTLDIICETAMGCKVHAQTQESKYVNAMHRMMPLLMQKTLRPWNQVDAIYWLNPKGREYFRCLKIILDFTDEVIKQRRGQFQPATEITNDIGVRKRRPFLDLLLEVSASGTALTDKEINEEVNTFMFEGHDTTAMTLNWFLYCMAANPKHQERVHEELDQLFGDSDRPCTRQDLSELKYLECCIKETLRLYPSVPAFSRHPTEPIQIGDYTLPVGHLSFVISAYAMHRNPRFYPDPLAFDPERFTLENSVGRHPYAFVPFSAGPRNCIGQKFAMAEEKVVLSSLLRRFKFELSPTAPLPRPSIELTLKSSTGIHLLVSRR